MVWTSLGAPRKLRIEKSSGLEASRTLQDDLKGLKHYACIVFCGLGDATSPSGVANNPYPGPPKPYNFYMIINNISWDWDYDLEGLKHYACSVFCGPGDAPSLSDVANSTYLGTPKAYNFYMITYNISWDWDRIIGPGRPGKAQTLRL